MNLKLGAGGDSCDWNSGGIVRGGGGGLDLEFPQGTSAYFMDLISWQVKHELT